MIRRWRTTSSSRDRFAHLEALTAYERATVLDAIGNQLVHEPLVETRRRKPLRPNPVAPWELCVASLRVRDGWIYTSADGVD